MADLILSPCRWSSRLPPAHSRPEKNREEGGGPSVRLHKTQAGGAESNGRLSMIKRRLLVTSLAALALLVIGACGSSSPSGAGGVIKVGITGPFTGPYADPGSAIRNAGELAIEDINAAGGINGRMLQAVALDDACGAQQGTHSAEKLLTLGIRPIVGGYCPRPSIPEGHIPPPMRDL